VSDSESESIVLIPDDLNHISVYILMDYVYHHFNKKISINTINIFSDGAGSQFKQISILKSVLLETGASAKLEMDYFYYLSWEGCSGWSQWISKTICLADIHG